MVHDRSWVSKSDVASYLRCPYAFWLTCSGQLSRTDLLTPFEKKIMREGVAFERGIVDATRSIVMPLGSETELFSQDFTIPAVRTFENPSLGLIGKPDGIVTANGRFSPSRLSHTDYSSAAIASN